MDWFIVKRSGGFDAVDLSKCTAIIFDEKKDRGGFTRFTFYDIRNGSVSISLKPYQLKGLRKLLEE